MKKFKGLLITVCLVITLVGCESPNHTVAGKTTLNLALREGTYSEVIKSCLAEFEEKHNVVCDVVELSEADLRETILKSKNNLGSVDLCMVDGSWMAQFAEEGLLTNLSEYGYTLDNDIIPATTDISYYQGEIYLAPYYGNVTVLMYNKQLLQQAGYRIESIESLKDVYQVCASAHNNGKNGFLYRGDTANNLVVDFLPILLSFGGWVVDEEYHPIVNSEDCINAVTYYKSLIATGDHMSRDELMSQLVNGEAAMAIGWPGWYVAEDAESMGYTALSGRSYSGGAAYNANVYGIWTLGVASTSDEPVLAVELLEYLMDPQVQKASIEMGGVPCRYSSLLDVDVLEEYPHYESICTALESGQYRPIMSQWNEFSDILGKYLEQIIREEVSVKAGLDAAQEELEQLMQ